MSRFKLYFTIFSLCFQISNALIIEKVLCIDTECSKPVSYAKTKIRYFPKDSYYLPFKANEEVVIYSKSVGSKKNVWIAEIKGKRGYINGDLVLEHKVLGTPTLTVDTEVNEVSDVPHMFASKNEVRPSKVKQNYEVIDGTRIYIQPEDSGSEESQDKAAESITVGSDSSISDLKNITLPLSKELDGSTVDNTLKNEAQKIYSDIDNIIKHNEDTVHNKNVNVVQDIKDIPFDQNNTPEINSEFSNNRLNDEESDQTSRTLLQSNRIHEMKIDSMHDAKEKKELDDNEEINKIETQSSKSSKTDSDETGNFSGIFGNVIGMMKIAIDGNDATENEENEALEEKQNTKMESLNNESELNDFKPDVSKESTVQETKKDFGENIEKQSMINNNHPKQVDVFYNENNSEKTIDPQNNVESFSTENIEGNIKVEVNMTENVVIDQNEEVSEEENSVEGIGVQQVLNFPKLIDNETISFKHTTENYEEKLIDEQNSESSEKKNYDLKKLPKVLEDFVEGEKAHHYSNSPYQYEEKIDSNVEMDTAVDNPTFSDSNVLPEVAKTDQKTSASLSNHHSFEVESANDNNIEYTNTKYKKHNQSIEQPEAFDKANSLPPVSDESINNNIENRTIGSIPITSNKSNEVRGEYSPINEFEKVVMSTPESFVESDDKYTNNFNEEETESYKNENYIEKDENQVYKHESREDIEVLNESSTFFNSEADQRENVVHLNSDEINMQNSARSVIDSVLESPNNHADNFKQREIESQQLKEQRSYLDLEKNESREYESDENSEILQESLGVSFDLINSDDDQKEIADSLNNEKLHEQYSEKIVHTVAERETISMGYFTAIMDLPILSSELCLYLVTTAVSVVIFLLGYFALDKSRREAPLVAKINKLEKEFLIVLKEKELLVEEIENGVQNSEYVESHDLLNLQKQYEVDIKEKLALKEEIQTLEKELENSTEVGLELNRMLSDILNSENAGSILMSNIEGLQAQLVEQQGIVSSMKEMLNLKETENHELHLELEIGNKKVVELQGELDKLLLNIIKMEEEKDIQDRKSLSETTQLKEEINFLTKNIRSNEAEKSEKIQELKNKLSVSERNLQLKIKEFEGLKISLQQMKNLKNVNTLDSLLDVNSMKAELEQLKSECHSHCETLRHGQETNALLEKRAKASEDEADSIKKKFDEVDKARLELETKLEVLTNYFKEKEAQLQRELSKYESMWSVKQGEATSTSERIKYLQSEVQNYKAQNESLKQEIVSQEVELKSQISVLEKKVHENWVSGRQAERRLEDLKQEAAHLRNRLTLRERALQEDKVHNRIQSPLEQKVDLPISPLHLGSTSSPPLLYDTRDHITKSPPILAMPPPFLPPPPGNPFLPPPHLPFMPPPLSDMFPGDRRPPPLGRMSSPPLNSRYSPDRRSYSPYERRSPSPSYDESEYGTSPVRHRRYSPFSNRIDHRRMGRMNGRSGELSSGSGNSNESINGMKHSNAKV